MLPKLPTIEEAGRLMRAKELTPLDLVEHCLGRIAQFEDRIHAWVLVDEEGARKEARRQTDMLARGEDFGPLHGIPIGIKDIIDVAGWQTKCGSRLRENVPPAEKDATVVANLRKAGAIILGKTVTTEFACFDPPPTRNPWNLNHTPGGSSSGSAAAVAMEMCMAALGTQTGGSIIRPAAYCGVCGFKPNFDNEILEGIFPLTMRLDHVGPIAKCVADLGMMHIASRGAPSFNWALLRSERVPRLAICDSYFRDESTPDVWGAFSAAIEELKAGGVQLVSLPYPHGFDRVHEMHRRIMAAEAALVHRAAFERTPDGYSRHVRNLIEEGLRLNAVDYAEALDHHRKFQVDARAWLRGDYLTDGVILPATPSTAPTTDSTGDPKFNSPWSYAGNAVATIPIGVDRAGLPMGMQFLGGLDHVLEVSQSCERILSWKSPPPLLEKP